MHLQKCLTFGFTSYTGGISFPCKTLKVIGDARGRFRLVLRTCICYASPAEAGLTQSLSRSATAPFTQSLVTKNILR